MAASSAAAALGFCALLLEILLLRPSPATAQPATTLASDACTDFSAGTRYPGSAWTLDDCVEVWRRFRHSVPPGLQRRLPDVDLWGDTGLELRRAGSPCLVASKPTLDGAGSSTIRHLATWIYSEQMGCDWVTPDWGKQHVGQGNGTEVMYCHRTATSQELDKSKPRSELQAVRRCSVIDWLSYFQFNVRSVELPKGATLEYIEPSVRSTDRISSVMKTLETDGFSGAPWDHLVFTFHPTYASSFLLNPGSWDDRKRETVRRVLRKARTSFHRHPRPWYDENPNCAYSQGRLHFAVHVRMGDRREFQAVNVEYFELLEVIMNTISVEVLSRGLQTPLFHVFSETLVPCPSKETGLFDEFPTWPVGVDQVPGCLAAPTPDDCPEKRAGQFCSPARDGIFEVVDKNIVLHVGPGVQEAMSCMIQADGVLMGCSTFGQVAGLLTKGVKMFSMQCGGASTPDQYKTIPPLAVAERGHLWVPVAGSWRDPALISTALLGGALDTLLAERDLAV